MGNAAQQQLLESIATGNVMVAPALDEHPRHDLRATATRATRTDAGYRLDGCKTLVPDGSAADYLLVLARSAAEPGAADGLSLFLVKADSAGVSIARTQLVDHHDWAEVSLDAVEISADALVGGEGKARGPVDACLDRARVCVAAMLLGISSEVSERTLAYVKERKQFGVPVGSFQALQHRAAQLFCEIELLKSLVLRALQAADQGAEELPLLASAAKTKACRTARLAVNEAVQMHGGMGMTDEFDIGFFMKRAASLQQLYGDSYAMEDRFASLKGY
jgi:alkylation response protein AidB-like acyl-CoA dehydrogenase